MRVYPPGEFGELGEVSPLASSVRAYPPEENGEIGEASPLASSVRVSSGVENVEVADVWWDFSQTLFNPA